jgi:hypothetical protein
LDDNTNTTYVSSASAAQVDASWWQHTGLGGGGDSDGGGGGTTAASAGDGRGSARKQQGKSMASRRTATTTTATPLQQQRQQVGWHGLEPPHSGQRSGHTHAHTVAARGGATALKWTNFQRLCQDFKVGVTCKTVDPPFAFLAAVPRWRRVQLPLQVSCEELWDCFVAMVRRVPVPPACKPCLERRGDEACIDCAFSVIAGVVLVSLLLEYSSSSSS